MFGREMWLPLDVMVGVPEARPDHYGEYVSQLKSQLSDAFQDVWEHLRTAQHRQKEYFDRGVKQRIYQPGDQVFLFNPQLRPGEAGKFHRKWKGPYDVLESTTEVNYRIKRPRDPVSRSKVVRFDNLKLYQRGNPEKDVSRKNQTGNRGRLEKEREDVLESPEGSGTICRDDLSEDRDVDEPPDFCLPIPEPVGTEHHVIQDAENSGTRKVDDKQPYTHNGVEDIDRTPQFDDHQPEAHVSPGNQVGKADTVLDVQCNPGAMSDLGKNTPYTTRESEQESTLVADGGVELAEKNPPGVTAGSNLVGLGVSAKGTPPASSGPKRVICPPDRYGDWELNTICSSGYSMAPKNKVESLKAFLQKQTIEYFV